MSDARAGMRARSIVGLYRDATIETLPIEEVKADLDRLEIDPSPLIALARRLADGSVANPAARLLQKLEISDAIESEIEEIEQAPIETIRSSLPENAAEPSSAMAERRAFETAKAQERAVDADIADAASTDSGSSFIPLKPGRRAVLGWGASLAGVAACVLLFVAVRPDVLGSIPWMKASTSPSELSSGDQATEPSVAEEADTALPKPAPLEQGEIAGAASRSDRELQPSEDTGSLAEVQEEPARPSGDVRQAAELDQSAPGQRETSAPSEPPTVTLSASTEAPNALSSPNPPAARTAAEKARPATAQGNAPNLPSHVPVPRPALAERTPEPRETVERSAGSLRSEGLSERTPALPDELTGVLVVDADRAPAALKALESTRRDDRLAAKLAEASLRALGRKVLALVAFERDGRRVEAALVENRQAKPGAPEALNAFGDTAALEQVREQSPAFELLELPNGP